MAIPTNGYVDEADAYAFARSRFPNNFTTPASNPVFAAALLVAGDIVNSNASAFLGKARPGLTGGRVWPRESDGGTDEEPYLTSTLPDPLLRGVEWLAVGVALSPEEFETIGTSSGEVITTTGGGYQEIGYGNFRLKKSDASTRRTTSTGNTLESVPFELRFHFQQALTFFMLLIREGAEFRIPGLSQQSELEVQEEPNGFAQAEICRA